MAGQPIATVGSMHVCPLCSGTVPHVGGPVNGPGMPGVTVNGQVVAVMGDMCTCVGPPDMIAQGSPGVTINGTPVATMGCMTAHAGQIVQGIPGVTIGPAVPTPNATMPLRTVPFPQIKIIDKLGAFISGNSEQLKEGEAGIEQLKKEAAKTEEEEGIVDSEEYSISSVFGVNQLNRLANDLSQVTFISIIRPIFGNEIPRSAYRQIYRDFCDLKIDTIEIEVIKGTINGRVAGYNNNEQKIILSEKTLQSAIDNEEERLKLLAIVTEEYGHHVDYLLRNEYSDVGGDARYDEGAVLAYTVFDINPFENSSIDIGEVTSPDFSGMLSIDLSELHEELLAFVDEEEQLDDGKSADGAIEHFNAGRLAHGYGHENIDDALGAVGFDFKDELPHVFFGNWMRDLSQLICGNTTQLSPETINELKAGGQNEDYLASYKFLEPAKFPREELVEIVAVLGAHEFVYKKNKEKYTEDNAKECVDIFNKFYGGVTADMLGCYRPEEHMDNPKGLVNERSSQHEDFFMGCHNNQLKIDFSTGMKLYLKNSFDANGNIVEVNNYQSIDRPSPYHYILNRLESMVNKDRSADKQTKILGLQDFGAALHVLEDWFAHTNFVEIALIKLVNPKVYPWIEKVNKNGVVFNPSTIFESYLKDDAVLNKIKVVDIPTNLQSKQKGYFRKAQIIPLVSGVFGTIDTMATLSNKMGHFFDIGSYEYKKPVAGQRTFADLMIEALGDGAFIGQEEDAAQDNSTYTGKAVDELEGDSWLKSSGMWIHQQMLTFHDYRAEKIKEGGFTGGFYEGIDRAMDFTGYAISKPMSLGIETLSLGTEKSIKEYETYPRAFGTDPTHTQVNKDDPGHPINDLAGLLAVEAVKRVGKCVRDIKKNFASFEDLINIVDDIMSHPCQSTWMDTIVKDWATKYPDRVKSLEESSIIEISQRIYKEQKAEYDKYSSKINNSLLEYEKE